MYVILDPDDYPEAVRPIAQQALELLNGIAGLGGDHIDEELDVADASAFAATAVIALLDLLYDRIDEPHDAAVAALGTYLRDVAAVLERRPERNSASPVHRL